MESVADNLFVTIILSALGRCQPVGNNHVISTAMNEPIAEATVFEKCLRGAQPELSQDISLLVKNTEVRSSPVALLLF